MEPVGLGRKVRGVFVRGVGVNSGAGRGRGGASWLAGVLCGVCSLLMSVGISQAQAPSDEPNWLDLIFKTGDFDPEIPTPASVIGFDVGSDAVGYDALVAYLQRLASASPYVTMVPHGRTHEGRTLYDVTITSEANQAALERILANNAKLADPRTLTSEGEADAIIESLPGIAWLANQSREAIR